MFAPQCERTVFHQLSFVAGIAGFEAIAPHLSDKRALQIKWPNDLLINTSKVGGILVESSKYGGDIVVMIGIGINIAVAPEIEGRAVTRLDQHGLAPGPQQLLEGLAGHMAHWLLIWDRGAGFEAIRGAWLERAHKLGQPLGVNTNDKHIEGAFQGLAANGALLLALSSGETVRIDHGDVSLASQIPVSEKRT